MAEYKAIRGHTIRTIAGDPSPLITGDIWYSSTTRKIRGAKLGAGAWASGGDTNDGHERGGASGTQTAATVFGGGASVPSDPGPAESYDGSSWTEVTGINTSRQAAGAAQMAPSTTSLFFGGVNPAISGITELYNGTGWTEVGDMNTARGNGSGFGTSTAAVCAGGATGPTSTNTDAVEEYNGTSWTAVTAMPATMRELDAAGIITSGLVFAGNTGAPARVGVTNEYDGTNWTSGGALNTAREAAGGFGATQDAALCFGGEAPSPTANTEEYDGISLTEVANLTNSRNSSDNAGNTTAGLCIAGSPPADLKATEEWTKPQNVEVITD